MFRAIKKAIVFILILTFFSSTSFAMELKSETFKNGGTIPQKYTCDGEDMSPPLSWSNLPIGTKSLALISDDPDAPVGTWVHWVVYGLPSHLSGLDESVPKIPQLENGVKQGLTDFKRVGYGGPCPPPGKPHHYYFKLYALDQILDLPPGVTKAALLKAVEGHVLAHTELIGIYERGRK